MKVYLYDAPVGFVPAPREYAGNMCGLRIAGLPPIPGGYPGKDDLFMSWFLGRYSPDIRRRLIYPAYRYPDLLLSWPDERAQGMSPAQFGALCREVIAHGKRPAVMLLSKDYDPRDVAGCRAAIEPVIPHLRNVVPRACLGFELDFLQPEVLHALLDWCAPIFVAWGCKFYVHFSPGKGSWQEDGHYTDYFWNAHIGQLTGLWHQRIPGTTADEYQYGASGCLDDMLMRFAGGFNFSPDSGFGHPWDLIALEITASDQAEGGMSVEDGDRWGRVALSTRSRMGPLGPVPIMGSGNGY